MKKRLPREGGFAYVAAVLLMVVVAALAAAIVRLNAAQQTTANDAVLVTRASQAARAGVEWMSHNLALANDPAANGGCAMATLDLRAASGFLVTVRCTMSGPFIEGYDTVDPNNPGGTRREYLYRIESVACNGTAATCPDDDSADAPDYTERRRVATVCLLERGTPALPGMLNGC